MSLKVLVVAIRVLKPDTSAGDLRFFKMLQLLAQDNEIDFCVTTDERDRKTDEELLKIDQYCLQLEKLGINVIPYGWKNIEIALLRKRCDLSFLEFYHVAKSCQRQIRWYNPLCKIIVDTVDIIFNLEKVGDVEKVRAAKVLKTKTEELSVYRNADALITVIDSDTMTLLEEGGMPPIFEIPIIMSVRAQSTIPKECEVIFVGGFSHWPNLDGVLWFIERVWPTIHGAIGHARFTVIGSNLPAEVAALSSVAGVNIMGFVEDTGAILDRAAVSVAPLRYGGAGMKGKVAEALASGVAVVSTSVGAQGLNAVSGEHLLIMDRPDDFAEAVIELLRNPARCQTMGRAGQQLVDALRSPESAKQTLSRLSGTIIQPSPVYPPNSRMLRTLLFPLLHRIFTLLAPVMDTSRDYLKPFPRYVRSKIRQYKPNPAQ